MKTENTTTTATTATKHDSAFIEAIAALGNARKAVAMLVCKIAAAMKVSKDAEEKDLKPLRAHLRSLLESAKYNPSTAAQYASELTREFTGKESGPSRVTFNKGHKAIGKSVIETLEKAFPEADKKELIKGLAFAIRQLRKS